MQKEKGKKPFQDARKDEGLSNLPIVDEEIHVKAKYGIITTSIEYLISIDKEKGKNLEEGLKKEFGGINEELIKDRKTYVNIAEKILDAYNSLDKEEKGKPGVKRMIESLTTSINIEK